MSRSVALEQRWGEFSANNRSLRVLVLGLLGANLLLIGILAFRSHVVTIIPPDAKGVLTYERSTASDDVLTSWSLYVSTLLGNVTPKNAPFVTNAIGQLLSPSIYQEVMRSVAEQAKHIETDQLTLSFAPADIKFDRERNAVFVTGWLVTQDAHGTANREQRTYELWWAIANYQPRLVGLKAYNGTAKFGDAK